MLSWRSVLCVDSSIVSEGPFLGDLVLDSSQRTRTFCLTQPCLPMTSPKTISAVSRDLTFSTEMGRTCHGSNAMADRHERLGRHAPL